MLLARISKWNNRRQAHVTVLGSFANVLASISINNMQQSFVEADLSWIISGNV
jgi:hypothetical protein